MAMSCWAVANGSWPAHTMAANRASSHVFDVGTVGPVPRLGPEIGNRCVAAQSNWYEMVEFHGLQRGGYRVGPEPLLLDRFRHLYRGGGSAWPSLRSRWWNAGCPPARVGPPRRGCTPHRAERRGSGSSQPRRWAGPARRRPQPVAAARRSLPRTLQSRGGRPALHRVHRSCGCGSWRRGEGGEADGERGARGVSAGGCADGRGVTW